MVQHFFIIIYTLKIYINMKCMMCEKKLEGLQTKYCSINCNSLYFYHKNKKLKGRNKNKITYRCKNSFCGKNHTMTEIGYSRYKDGQCSECRKYKKECEVCETIHNKQGRTCSSDCASVLKRESYMKSCGTEHNMCRESTARKLMIDNLIEKYGVNNIFKIPEVKNKIKETMIEKYGVDNPSKSLDIMNKKLLTMIDNNITVPLEEQTEFDIYRRNCYSFTLFNLNRYAKKKFGNDWEKERGINKKHVNHILSIKEGFENKVEPEIVGSICNLQFISGSINISKGSSSWIEVDTLRDNFKKLKDNDMEYDSLLLEKIEKNNKYFYNEN